ncbi:DUF1320 domain-containing protein [bacterium]|nr:DUF1320 domain-containing protein [bacterium]
MPTQTYCTLDDLKAILGSTAVLRLLDDNEDGVTTSLEQSYASDVIAQAASQINAVLSMRYDTGSLASNTWCRWCNAYLAASLLVRRRGNPADASLEEVVRSYRDQLEQIRTGQLNLPDATPEGSKAPAVSNYRTNLGAVSPICLDRD